MKFRKIAILLLALLLPASMLAQKKRKTVSKPAVVVPPEPQEDPRITEMREATQQIIFIDSVVVDKNNFLSAIRLNAESGQLLTADQFFSNGEHSDGFVYLNEMGNKCYFSDKNDAGKMQLYTSDKLGNEWSDPQALKGISEGISQANYPFMMTDGTTFYFAATGQESIGGYDIFMTRYDSEDGQFLKPENIGMPFNSEANDYMYAIDELTGVGYFATDRRQPAGKVCVYLFIPPTSRKTYNTDNYSDEQLRAFADIQRIANTWGNGKERKQALERIKAMSAKSSDKQKEGDMRFVINDELVYTAISQFRHPDSPTLYSRLTEMRKTLTDSELLLEKSRKYYVKANKEDKQALRAEILDAERQVELLNASVKKLEKQIRNAENLQLNK